MRNTKLRNVEYKIFGTLQSKDEVVTTNYIEPIDAKIKVIGRMAVGDGFIADFFAAEMIRETDEDADPRCRMYMGEGEIK